MNKNFISAILKELSEHAIKRLTFLILLLSSAHFVQAKEVTHQFNDWIFYAYGGEFDRHCLIYSESLRARGEFDQERETPYLYLTKRGNREFSLGVSPGYPLDVAKGVDFTVNFRSYGL